MWSGHGRRSKWCSGRRFCNDGPMGDYSNPWSMGKHFAELAYEQIREEAEPPTSQEEVEEAVDRITPDAMNDIGVMMARQAGSKIAVPKDVVAGIESGFRQRLRELLSQHLA
jgi:hypothetical protein